MTEKLVTAARMGLKDQARRPLLVAMLVVAPFLMITWSFYVTESTPHLITLPGGHMDEVTMRELHGAIMVPITVALLAGLIGLFVILSARAGDRRLVIAGFHPLETVLPRLIVMATAILVVVAVSLAVTTIDFTPVAWLPFIVGNLFAGAIYGMIGALAGAYIGKLGAAYLMFFLPMLDLGVEQNPMFGNGPALWAKFLPGYGPTRILIDGAFSSGFEATIGLLAAAAWTLCLGIGVIVLLRRYALVDRSGETA